MTSEASAGKVLGNIHNLVTWHHGQNYLFNGCMQYLMECLHESNEYSYWFFSGVTGDSFVQLYRAEGTEQASSLSHDAFDHDLARKAFDACGYDFTYVDRAGLDANRAELVQRIVQYINDDIPVIAHGFGDDASFSAICGYDNGGETLLALRGDETEPVSSQNGLDNSKGLVFVESKRQAPSPADARRGAVMAIPSLISIPPRDGLVFGRQAFEAWAEGLLCDDTFRNVSDEDMDGVRWRTHCGLLCIAGTNGCSRGFLEKTLEMCPDMTMIPPLQPIYERMQSIFEEIAEMQGGFFIPFETLRDAESRRSISRKIHDFSQCCDEILDITSTW